MRANGIPARLMQGQACDFVPLSDSIRNAGIRRDEWGLSFHAMGKNFPFLIKSEFAHVHRFF